MNNQDQSIPFDFFSNLDTDSKQNIMISLKENRDELTKAVYKFYGNIIESCIDNGCIKSINNKGDMLVDLRFLSKDEKIKLKSLDDETMINLTDTPIKIKGESYVILNNEFKKHEPLNNYELNNKIKALEERLQQFIDENTKLKKEMLYKDERVAIADDIIQKKEREEFETSDKFKYYRECGVTYEEYRSHDLDGKFEDAEWMKELAERKKYIGIVNKDAMNNQDQSMMKELAERKKYDEFWDQLIKDINKEGSDDNQITFDEYRAHSMDSYGEFRKWIHGRINTLAYKMFENMEKKKEQSSDKDVGYVNNVTWYKDENGEFGGYILKLNNGKEIKLSKEELENQKDIRISLLTGECCHPRSTED